MALASYEPHEAINPSVAAGAQSKVNIIKHTADSE